MKTKQLLKATLVALLASVSLTLSHGSAWAISCGDTLGPGGNYTLTADLHCSSSFALFVIGPVTVDLNGHTLHCSNFAGGIAVSGNSAQISNGLITGCEPGVETTGSKHQLSFLVVQDYGYTGFDIESDKSSLEHNFATTSRGVQPYSAGFYIIGVSNTLSQNAALGNNAGFWDRGTKTTYTENAASRNYFGFFADTLKSSQQSVLTKNTASKNAVGIGWYGSAAQITKNTVTKNTIVGLGLFANGGSLVSGNTVTQNPGDLYDTTLGCGTNMWKHNNFATANQACIH